MNKTKLLLIGLVIIFVFNAASQPKDLDPESSDFDVEFKETGFFERLSNQLFAIGLGQNEYERLENAQVDIYGQIDPVTDVQYASGTCNGDMVDIRVRWFSPDSDFVYADRWFESAATECTSMTMSFDFEVDGDAAYGEWYVETWYRHEDSGQITGPKTHDFGSTTYEVIQGTQDSDGDGVNDENDICPGTPSGAEVGDYGCAVDTDGDDVPDYYDDCPDEYGEKDNGCPETTDSDGDGVPDDQDECPNEYGEQANGCPETTDSDGDGVNDPNDLCPGTPSNAEVDSQGCAVDSDGDGVADYEDAFPNDPNRSFDSDGDGVADSNDACPGTPSGVQVDDQGCEVDQTQDSDGDGVNDENDLCPGTPSGVQVDQDGCQIDTEPTDSDGDGVPDDQDQCPGTPSSADQVDQDGCAIGTGEDTDGDLVLDAADECPRTYGTKQNGCPTFIDKIINFLGLRPFFK
jgi:hypothetical protein